MRRIVNQIVCRSIADPGEGQRVAPVRWRREKSWILLLLARSIGRKRSSIAAFQVKSAGAGIIDFACIN